MKCHLSCRDGWIPELAPEGHLVKTQFYSLTHGCGQSWRNSEAAISRLLSISKFEDSIWSFQGILKNHVLGFVRSRGQLGSYQNVVQPCLGAGQNLALLVKSWSWGPCWWFDLQWTCYVGNNSMATDTNLFLSSGFLQGLLSGLCREQKRDCGWVNAHSSSIWGWGVNHKTFIFFLNPN
jgi:hypothetical protein